MRGRADHSDTYPFEVKEVPANQPISSGGFAAFKVNTQEFVPGAPVRKTYAEAVGDVAKYKAGEAVHA